MALKPLNDKIVVKRLEAEDKSAGGILLPDSAREKPRQGKVLSVGQGHPDLQLVGSAGDMLVGHNVAVRPDDQT